MTYVRTTVGTTQRREFSIVSGLRESFASGNHIHHVQQVHEIVNAWNLERAKRGIPYLPTEITEGTYNWVWGSGENAVSGLEPRAKIEGNLSNSHLSELPDSEAEEMIEELAKLIAGRLGQEYIEFGYKDRWYSLKIKG